MDNEHLLKDAIAAFNSARDAGYELPECLRAVLNVAAPRDVSGPGMGIVSLEELNPGEEGPEISLRDADHRACKLKTVALSSDIYVAPHPSGNGFVAVHAGGFHQWVRQGGCDYHLEVVDISADVGPPIKGAIN